MFIMDDDLVLVYRGEEVLKTTREWYPLVATRVATLFSARGPGGVEKIVHESRQTAMRAQNRMELEQKNNTSVNAVNTLG